MENPYEDELVRRDAKVAELQLDNAELKKVIGDLYRDLEDLGKYIEEEGGMPDAIDAVGDPDKSWFEHVRVGVHELRRQRDAAREATKAIENEELRKTAAKALDDLGRMRSAIAKYFEESGFCLVCECHEHAVTCPVMV